MAKCQADEANDESDEVMPPAWEEYEARAGLAARAAQAAKQGEPHGQCKRTQRDRRAPLPDFDEHQPR